MTRALKGLVFATFLAVGGCIDSGNRGWDFGGEPDAAGGGAIMEQAWRGVHEGRIGFRCREGQVLLFVETWHPLDVQPGERLARTLSYRFDVGGEIWESVQGMATSRGIEIPAPQVGANAPNPLLRGLTDDADELLVTLNGAGHLISILFDISYATHAHSHVQGGCARRPAPAA